MLLTPEILNWIADPIIAAITFADEDIERSKNPQPTVVQQVSAADEIKKFKELLDLGVITQEEFDAKKKQLLGL